MKLVLPVILLCTVLFSGCKKTIEKIKEDKIAKVMADGQWRVARYTEGSDFTEEFDELVFQFYENKTVTAFKNGGLLQTGTWDGDVDSKTIWTDFGAASVAPLPRLNKTWTISDNSWIYVEAVTEGASMRLEKL